MAKMAIAERNKHFARASHGLWFAFLALYTTVVALSHVTVVEWWGADQVSGWVQGPSAGSASAGERPTSERTSRERPWVLVHEGVCEGSEGSGEREETRDGNDESTPCAGPQGVHLPLHGPFPRNRPSYGVVAVAEPRLIHLEQPTPPPRA
jgi:hypothetical protein